MLRLEIWTEALATATGLAGTGVLVINPPWTLISEAGAVWPELAAVLATAPGAGGFAGWLSP